MALLEVWNMEGQWEIHLASPLEPEQSSVPVHLYTMLSLEPEQKQSEDWQGVRRLPHTLWQICLNNEEKPVK